MNRRVLIKKWFIEQLSERTTRGGGGVRAYVRS
jgi:hypothetical protein